MTLFQCLLLGFLVICAVSVSFSKNLLNSILIFMSYSLVMSIIWICLESPDLAITEAAVGAGVTSVLFFVTLKKIHAIRQEKEGQEKELQGQENGPQDQTQQQELEELHAIHQGTKEQEAGGHE